ncbi:hypothetical protein [Pseudomonas phage Njord]|uniref:Uncharacterized protein n=1 Tax=Pseudomonas phage Njord TaxID=2163985 RepID=A0A2S1GMI3_9CAUD|nr:hypothetical protein HOT08_gp09 [Pseudomonas phage Njord]AWD90597.1 hypothetical protein [Pseudomonas phage Njord]
MQHISDVISSTQYTAVESLRGKEVIYFREGAKRHLWIGKVTHITTNGVKILYRNGIEQPYSLSYFRNHFAPAHWKANQNIYCMAGNMNANYVGQALRAYDVPACDYNQLELRILAEMLRKGVIVDPTKLVHMGDNFDMTAMSYHDETQVSVKGNPEKEDKEPAAKVSDLGEFYVWRIGGDIPKKIHLTMDEALAEASRLSTLHPRCCFKVLHVAATVVCNPVTTYDTNVVIH